MFRNSIAVTTILLSVLPAIAQSDAQELQKVDLELVLAGDISGSVPSNVARSQKSDFADAFREPDLQNALASGPYGAVAVTYFVWSGANDQHVVVPWTILRNTEDITAFADRLEAAQIPESGGETSLSGAMLFAGRLLETNRYSGLRKVVDITSNGRNSDGSHVEAGRHALRATGAVVNALVMPGRTLDQTGPYATLFAADAGPLDDYYQTEVIGGPGAFVQTLEPDVGHSEAILRKLVLEVAWLTK